MKYFTNTNCVSLNFNQEKDNNRYIAEKERTQDRWKRISA